MKFKAIAKKCLWVILIVFLSVLIVQGCQEAVTHFWTDKPTFRYYAAVAWEMLKEIAVILPIWLLSLLGLARSFLGENWFPFAKKIPIRFTEAVLIIATILLMGVMIAWPVYAERTQDSYTVQNIMETRFETSRTILAWILFYSVLLYVEQWCVQKNCTRQSIRKKQFWIAVTSLLAWFILMTFELAYLWYIPLDRVDSPNTLEDYYLWWFELCTAIFYLPFLLFAARKMIRQFKGARWLSLSDIVPAKITALITIVLSGFFVWQIRECRYWSEWGANCEVPEYASAVIMKHLSIAMIWGTALFYAVCLLVKQGVRHRREKAKVNSAVSEE